MGNKVILLALLALFAAGCGSNAVENSAFDSRDYILSDSAATEQSQARTAEEYSYIPKSPSAAVTDCEADCGQRWFRFIPMSHEIAAPDGTMLLFETYDFPEFSARDSKTDHWGDEILGDYMERYRQKTENLLEYAQDAYRETPDTFYSYSNYLSFDVERNDEQVISLLTLSSIYSGGPHPTSIQMAYNMDLDRRKPLKLEDIVLHDQVQKFTEMVTEKVDEKFETMGEGALYKEYRNTVFQSLAFGSMTPYWYFDTDGLTVFFNQYEIAPYAAGIIKAELPYEELHGIIRENYIPASEAPGTCSLLLAESAGGKNVIDVNDVQETPLLIGSDQTAYQVKLYEVSWCDDMPVSRRLMFALNRMTPQDLLMLGGADLVPDRTYRIEYVDGNGTENAYYVTASGLEKE